jgi:hypothetical protein
VERYLPEAVFLCAFHATPKCKPAGPLHSGRVKGERRDVKGGRLLNVDPGFLLKLEDEDIRVVWR